MTDKKPVQKNQRPSPFVKLVAPASSAGGKATVKPVLQEVGKLAAGVAAVSTGSATGNPRNKCALQPGHSLMDWIRLGASGKDLTGVGPRAGHLMVTPAQLALHDKNTDAWLAVRGKVYNVTEYLPFHPGGPEELMRGAGKDATALFDQIHPWVNYDSILQKCYLGRLVAMDPKIDTEALFLGTEKKPSPTKPTVQSNTAKKLLSPQKVRPSSPKSVKIAEDDKISAVYGETIEDESLPRFDWLQKVDFITVMFYTRAFSNPQVEISPTKDNGIVSISLAYGSRVYSNEIVFHKEVEWPCQIKVSGETGKVEIQFRKTAGGIWENYGLLKQKSREANPLLAEAKFQYRIVKKVPVTHNTFLLELERLDSSRLVIPLGKHIRVYGRIKDEEISRSYTPVPCSLFSRFKCQPYTTDTVCLMVKRYADGNVSRHICDRNLGDLLEITSPLGSFDLRELENRETFVMLAAGTGITPMLAIILFLLERRIRKCQLITLLFFNQTVENIPFRSQLEALQVENKRFRVEHVLSRPDASWKGKSGHVTSEMLSTTLREHLTLTGHARSDVFFTVCGPTQFTNLTRELLVNLEVNKEQIHLFLG